MDEVEIGWIEIKMDSDTWERFKARAAQRGYPNVKAQELDTGDMFEKEYLFLSGCPKDIALDIKAEIKLAKDKAALRLAIGERR